MLQSLALILAVAPPLMAQTEPGQKEGVKVHGHWIIEVKIPTARGPSIAVRNALLPEGAGALGDSRSPSRPKHVAHLVWQQRLQQAQPCLRITFNTTCGIARRSPLSTVPTEYHPTPTFTAPTTGPNAGKLVLSGNATSSYTGSSSINFVMSQMRFCPRRSWWERPVLDQA
jgi:hypothetical protein